MLGLLLCMSPVALVGWAPGIIPGRPVGQRPGCQLSAATPDDDLDALPELGDLSCGKQSFQISSNIDGVKIPERFQMKVRALSGEFSPMSSEADNERSEGLILDGLVGFPALMPLRVVSRKSSTAEQESLVAEIEQICRRGGAALMQLEVTPRLGGAVASIAFSVSVDSANMLAEVRDALHRDPRVKMVF